MAIVKPLNALLVFNAAAQIVTLGFGIVTQDFTDGCFKAINDWHSNAINPFPNATNTTISSSILFTLLYLNSSFSPLITNFIVSNYLSTKNIFSPLMSTNKKRAASIGLALHYLLALTGQFIFVSMQDLNYKDGYSKCFDRCTSENSTSINLVEPAAIPTLIKLVPLCFIYLLTTVLMNLISAGMSYKENLRNEVRDNLLDPAVSL